MLFLSEAIVENLGKNITARKPHNFIVLLLVLFFFLIGLFGIIFAFWDGVRKKILPSAKPQLPLF